MLALVRRALLNWQRKIEPLPLHGNALLLILLLVNPLQALAVWLVFSLTLCPHASCSIELKLTQTTLVHT
jgi:hypothetical protein